MSDWLVWLRDALIGGDNQLHINVDADIKKGDQTKIVNKVKGNQLIVNINGPVTAEVVEKLRPVIDAYENKEVMFLADQSKTLVDHTREFETDPHVKGLLLFFKDKLPVHDYALLRTGLYLKHLTDENETEQIHIIQQQYQEKSNERDRRIINLASAGYFSTYFRPLYKTLSKHSNLNELFMQEYNNVLDNMTFAIFVHSHMTKEALIESVISRAVKNIRYGVRKETITVHAMGKNVEIVDEALPELKAKFTHIKTKRPVRNLPIIRVSIFYSENKLSEADFEMID